VGFQNSATSLYMGFYAALSYSLMRPGEDRSALDMLLGEVSGRAVRLGRAELAAAMRSPSVVVSRVLVQGGVQVPLAGDQHLAGELFPGGEHESLGVTVRPGAPRRNLHHLNTGISQDRVGGRGELRGPVPDQEPERRGAVAEVDQQVADLLGGSRAVRVRSDPGYVYVTGTDLMTNRQYRRCRVTAQSTWKKSVASSITAWGCRNFRHVVSVCRCGAGGIFSAFRARRIVGALTRQPSLSSSPWIR
jgi:hypothetical protein